MADIQKQIVQFDEKIRLARFDENQTLRDKRDIIVDKLRDRFAAMRREGKQVPTFDPFNQGSYEMGTGIHPVNGDYDIDVGLRFNCAKADYPNPVDLKILVADALEGHTVLGTEVRLSCVTVKYQVDGEQAYHVDLAIYAYDNPGAKGRRLFLAKGRRAADEQNRLWEESDPLGLTDWVDKCFQDASEDQFLRIIRLLKRWKTKKFQTDGANAPPGIGLTVAAGQWFQPQVRRDDFARKTVFDDVKAMRALVDSIAAQFQPAEVKAEGSMLYRLSVPIPVAPGKNAFAKMTPGQMTTFRERLLQLRDRLDEVTNDPDPVRACELMRKDFGDDFPVPEKSETAQRLGRAVSSSGVSA